MPLQKRKIYSGSSYAHSELWEDSEPSTILSDVNMGNTLGVLHQIGYLSSYCFEIFDGLTSLTDDMRSRLVIVGKRANSLVDNIEQLEQRRYTQRMKKMNPDFVEDDDKDLIGTTTTKAQKSLSFSPATLASQNFQSSQKRKEKISNTQAKTLFLSNRDSEIPDVLSTETNCSQIKSAYNMCSVAPSLWKIDDLLDEDYSLNYSNPGFFFAEWLRIEQERQAMYKAEQTKARQIRKALKNERKQLRELTEDQQRELFRQKNISGGKGGRSGSVQSMRTSLLSAALYDNSGVMLNKDQIKSKKAEKKKKKKKDKKSNSIDLSTEEDVLTQRSTASEEEKTDVQEKEREKGSFNEKKLERVSKIGGMFNSFFGSSTETDKGNRDIETLEKTKTKSKAKENDQKSSENLNEDRQKSTLGLFSRMFGGNKPISDSIQDEDEIEDTAGTNDMNDDSVENTLELSAREKAKIAKSRAKKAKRGNSFSVETNKVDGLMSQEDMDIAQSPMTPRERRETIKVMLANAEDIKKISNDEDDESSDDNENENQTSKGKTKLAMSTKSRRSSKSQMRKSIIPSSSEKEKLLESISKEDMKGKSEEKEKEKEHEKEKKDEKEKEKEKGKSQKFIDSSSDEDSGSDDSEARATAARKSKIEMDSDSGEEDEDDEESSSESDEDSSESDEDSSSEDDSSSSADSSSLSSSNDSQDKSSSPSKTASKRNLAPPPPPPMGGKNNNDNAGENDGNKRKPPPPPPPGATGNKKSGPPPPPPVARPRLGSALKLGIAQGMQLRKAEAPQPRPIDLRQNMLAAIKKGGPSLRKVERPSIVQKQRQIEAAKPPTAITAILQNRRHIAGSDSDDTEDSSDSDLSF